MYKNIPGSQGLLSILKGFPLEPYSVHSRVHRLSSFDTPLSQCYIKRDDELSFGISGSKLRKYLSFIPWLKCEGFKEVIVTGSAHSNHVLGITQLLKENCIKPLLFLLKSRALSLKGNFLLTSLLINQEDVYWIDRKEWPHIAQICQNFINSRRDVFYLPEGGCIEQSMIGALTLGLDIIYNEQQLDREFDHIFIDAGTGLIALSLLLVLSYLKKSTQMHIVHMADTSVTFQEKVEKFRIYFQQLLGHFVTLSEHVHHYHPKIARSFGSTNKGIFNEILQTAKTEGVILDPIYSAKLFYQARQVIQQQSLRGNILLIHSGGGIALSGFQEEISKLINIDLSK